MRRPEIVLRSRFHQPAGFSADAMRIIILVPCLLVSATALGAGAEKPHQKNFWRAIVANEYEAPAGMPLNQLVPELTGLLGSTDGERRDDLALNFLETWIYISTRRRPSDRTNPARESGPGPWQHDNDSVLRRSFSALTLAAVIARDNEDPFLEPETFRTPLEGALAYFAGERDLRGFDPKKGWMHSVAQTSDLLKFLARSPGLNPPIQRVSWTRCEQRCALRQRCSGMARTSAWLAWSSRLHAVRS